MSSYNLLEIWGVVCSSGPCTGGKRQHATIVYPVTSHGQYTGFGSMLQYVGQRRVQTHVASGFANREICVKHPIVHALPPYIVALSVIFYVCDHVHILYRGYYYVCIVTFNEYDYSEVTRSLLYTFSH